jgi:hypothetical protein
MLTKPEWDKFVENLRTVNNRALVEGERAFKEDTNIIVVIDPVFTVMNVGYLGVDVHVHYRGSHSEPRNAVYKIPIEKLVG